MMKKRIFSILLALTLCLSLLPTAVFAGEDGVTTVTLDADRTETYTVDEGKNVILDLNGHNITVSTGHAIENKGTLTVKDSVGTGTVSATSTTADNAAILNSGTLTLNGGTYENYKWFVVKNTGKMTVDGDVTIQKNENSDNTASIIINVGTSDKNAELTIKSGDFNGVSGKKSCSVVKNDTFGILNIEGGNFSSAANTNTDNATTILNWHKTTISGGVFTGQYPVSNGYNKTSGGEGEVGEVTISDGKFTGVLALFGQAGIAENYAEDGGKLTITGGEFNAPVMFKDSKVIKYETAISGGTFSDLAAAVQYATDGATIKLLDDTDCAGIVFPEDTFTTSGLTIDLNGKTLTLKDPMVGSAGTETNGFQILKGNKVTIQNGTIQSSAAKYLIQNYSDLTLDGVTLDGSDLKANSSNYTLSNNCGTVKIKNSTIIAKSGQYAFDVYGGFGSYSDVSVEVENSTINGNIEVARANTTNNNNNSLYFKSGELNGEIVKRNSCTDNTTISITGGYFTADPSAYKATGCYVHPVAEDDEHYGDYKYVVNDIVPTEDQYVFINGDTAAEIKEGLASNITDAAYPDNLKNNTVVMAEVALDKNALYNSLPDDIGNTIIDAAVVRVEVKVDVTVTEADLSDENGTMTFEATPTATVYADGQQVGSTTTVTNDMLTGEGITVYLPLPSGFTPKQIKHISANGSVEYFINATEGSKRGAKTFTIDPVDPDDPEGDRCAVFEITHFSKFVLTGTVDYVEPAIPSKPANDVTISSGLYGSVTANQTEAREGTIVTVTVTPNSGYTLDELTVTDKNGNVIPVTSIGGGKYTFIMPNGKVTVRATFTDGQNTGFVDVPADKYFYNAVNWAVASGITSGTDATHFSPYASCTRGQLVTFLWRAAGQPAAKATENAFSDVKESSSFYKAILWAAENGIVTGYSDGTFKPNASVTRQQTAAILYRYAKYAKMDVSVGEDTNILSFNDAFSVSEYAVSAFQWAVGEGVITGNGANLLPHDTCTRAQIVTMLYRLLAK